MSAMLTTATSEQPPLHVGNKIGGAEREIAMHTRGETHGPVTRLVSPDDLGHVIKPFILLMMPTVPPALALGLVFIHTLALPRSHWC